MAEEEKKTYTPKKTTRRSYAKPVEKVEKKKKKFEQNDGILCRSVTAGSLYFPGKSGQKYTWETFGDATEVEYRDLVSAVHSHSEYIYNPCFVIEDKDFIDEFTELKKFYSNSFSVDELKKILQLPVNQMVERVKALPKGLTDSFKTLISTEISEGHLDSLAKVKALDDIFDTDFRLMYE